MKKVKVSAILMIIHGGFMELGGCLALIPVLLTGAEESGIGKYFSFIVPYLQDNLNLMLVAGSVWGAVRLIGAIALLKNRMWGFALSVINCSVTLALMIFMLPAGIMDGILSAAALILMLSAFFGKKKFI
ncbi:MAG: hypothetical protein LBQ91_03955 [Oscillospiraceae bacterium]|nr:hypothetical protein [Oscillospiraceae bacterium]